MKVLGRDQLEKFGRKHAQAKKALEACLWEAEAADWKTPQDIKARFVTASFLDNNRVIFNIKGNHYRLVIKIKYEYGLVVIEWIGTHAEYDEMTF